MLPEFDFFRPTALPEALALLAQRGVEAMPLAGGTNVVVDLRHRKHQPAALVDVGRLSELRGIWLENGRMIMGAGTTISELLTDPLVAVHAGILADAARSFANPLIRNRATVGGNLADASPAADTAPPLLALGAEVALASVSGVRWLPLADFLVGVRQTLRRPDELLTAVRFPATTEDGRPTAGYDKVGLRRADAISVLSAAVVVARDESGRCRRAAIALGAVAPRPFRAAEAEAALRGHLLTAETIAAAARLAAAATRPISDIRGDADYRRRVTEVVVRRLLTQTVTPSDGARHGG
jgi:carbon-monoxide dehydrogenase medium subunit